MNAQAKAINEVMNAMKQPQDNPYGQSYGQLHVVNGISTTSGTSSTLTTAAKENVVISPTPANYEGLPRWTNSTLRTGKLQTHPGIQEVDEREPSDDADFPPLPPPAPRKQIIPSLATLEKAVAARIYFENIYFSLFRHVPSREQRRRAMERDMEAMNLTQEQKEMLRARWQQNETEYLRVTRQKLDASAFIKLKTIGHGQRMHSRTCSVSDPCSIRRFWGRVACQREVDRPTLRHEAGELLAANY